MKTLLISHTSIKKILFSTTAENKTDHGNNDNDGYETDEYGDDSIVNLISDDEDEEKEFVTSWGKY